SRTYNRAIHVALVGLSVQLAQTLLCRPGGHPGQLKGKRLASRRVPLIYFRPETPAESPRAPLPDKSERLVRIAGLRIPLSIRYVGLRLPRLSPSASAARLASARAECPARRRPRTARSMSRSPSAACRARDRRTCRRARRYSDAAFRIAGILVCRPPPTIARA